MKQKQIFIAKVSQNKRQTWIPKQLTTGLDKNPAQPSIKKLNCVGQLSVVAKSKPCITFKTVVGRLLDGRRRRYLGRRRWCEYPDWWHTLIVPSCKSVGVLHSSTPLAKCNRAVKSVGFREFTMHHYNVGWMHMEASRTHFLCFFLSSTSCNSNFSILILFSKK